MPDDSGAIHARPPTPITREIARVIREDSSARSARSCTSVHSSYPQEQNGAYACTRAKLARFRHFSTSRIHSSDNDLWKTFLLRFESWFSRLPSRSHRGRPFAGAARVFRNHFDQCISSAAQLPRALSKPRLARRSWPSHRRATVSRRISGTAFGVRRRTRTTRVARTEMVRSSGSRSPTTRPTRRRLTMNERRQCYGPRRYRAARVNPARVLR